MYTSRRQGKRLLESQCRERKYSYINKRNLLPEEAMK